MLHYKTLIVLTVSLILFPFISYSQKDSLPISQKPAIRLKTRIQKDKILLRWAVDQPIAWQKANIHGFRVERITVVRDGKVLQKVEKRSPKNAIKPRPLNDWKDIVQKDQKAAIIAQALYGDSFGVTETQQQGIGATLNKAEEQRMRFTFALMAADQSFEAARMAGWGFVDTAVKPNEKYLYRVSALVPNMKIDSASAAASLNDYHELPAPLGLMGRFGDKTATLSWDYQTLADYYTAYYIERSEDSIHFKNISDIPITNMITDDEPLYRMTYTDSLETNDKIYYYRIKGITSFGELSPPSDSIIKGQGRVSLTFAPNINEVQFLNDSMAILNWVYQEDTSKIFDHFEISQSDQSEGNYKIIVDNLKKGERKATVKGLMPTNYFMVAAVDKKGYKMQSFPYLVQPVDSIPPSVPTGLEGTVNDSGKVILKWKANTEKDIYGYHIFRFNAQGEEMSLITKEPIRAIEFVDSVSIEMINSKVYYAIAALDHRFNQSKSCPPVALTKPDKIPPISPVFTTYKLEEGKVHLKWENSPSEDVAWHRIFKRDAHNTETNGQWVLVKEFKGKDSTAFTDTKVAPESTVSYTIIAVDKSQNESKPSTPISVLVPKDKKNAIAVKNLKAEADKQTKKITIEWKYEEQGVVEYQLYKTSGKTPFTLWKVLDTTQSSIVDTEISPSNIYKYAIRAVFKDGSMSTWKEVKVEF